MTRRKRKPNKRKPGARRPNQTAPVRRSASGQQLNRGRPRKRRSNPSVKGAVVTALWVMGGAFATNIIAGFIPVQLAGWPAIALRAGVAWVTGWLAERFVSPANGTLVMAGGLGTVVGDGIKLLIGPQSAAITGTASLQQPSMPALPPGPPGMLPPAPPEGVADIVPWDEMGDITAWDEAA